MSGEELTGSKAAEIFLADSIMMNNSATPLSQRSKIIRSKSKSVFALLLCGFSLCAGTAYAKAANSNIVVIWGDDIGQSNISAYTHGLMGYQTPNIDRMAAEGTLGLNMTEQLYSGTIDWEKIYKIFHSPSRIAERIICELDEIDLSLIFSGFAETAACLASHMPVTFIDLSPSVTTRASEQFSALNGIHTGDVTQFTSSRVRLDHSVTKRHEFSKESDPVDSIIVVGPNSFGQQLL